MVQDCAYQILLCVRRSCETQKWSGGEKESTKKRGGPWVSFWGLFFLSLSFSELFYNSGSCGKLIAMFVILVRGNANYAQCNAIDYCSLTFFFFFFFASFVSICKFGSDSW